MCIYIFVDHIIVISDQSGYQNILHCSYIVYSSFPMHGMIQYSYVAHTNIMYTDALTEHLQIKLVY